MSNTSQGMFSCRNICWIVGALLGLVAWILIGGFWGLVVGIVLAIALALVLQRLFCTEAGAMTGGGTVAAGAASGAAAAASASDTGAAEKAAADKAAADKAAADKAAADKAADKAAAAKAAADKAAAKAAADKAAADKAAADKAAADKAAADKAAAEKAADKKDAADKAAAEAALAEVPDPVSKDFDGDGVFEGENEGTRPETLTAARDGKADDLKLIKGIGPKLEQLCNALGFYHYDQIANWTPDEVAWVNANLQGFKGRVSRDNWVAQAKTLAAGGTTEFAARAEKSGLYDDDKG